MKCVTFVFLKWGIIKNIKVANIGGIRGGAEVGIRVQKGVFPSRFSVFDVMDLLNTLQTLSKAQRAQFIEYFDSSINFFFFKAKASTSFEILVKFILVLFGKGQETWNNFDKIK